MCVTQYLTQMDQQGLKKTSIVVVFTRKKVDKR